MTEDYLLEFAEAFYLKAVCSEWNEDYYSRTSWVYLFAWAGMPL